MMELVLASGSPRREAILRMLGLEPLLRPGAAAERPPRAEEPPEAYAVELALEKLRGAGPVGQHEVTLAADTVVVLDGAVLGKPRDPADARAMLARLAGRDHDVVTGVAVRRGGRERAGFERTRVTFRAASAQTIAAYVATGQPLDKAGAYGIQDRGAALVSRVDGCFYNVMGLPVARTLELLAELGVGYDAAAGRLVDVEGIGERRIRARPARS